MHTLITIEQINTYITKIPPAPDALKKTLLHLNNENLSRAASAAQEDNALSSYLKTLVNSPIYGFSNVISDIPQMFGVLGVPRSQQVVYNYMLSLLSPDKWKLFKLNKTTFHNLQSDLSVHWQKILTHLKIIDPHIQSSISLLPATIIVSEALFCENIEDVNQLRSVNPIDLNSILQRLCNVNLFDLCQMIAEKWDMGVSTSQIIQASSGLKPSENKNINILGKWMHLLLFYILSKPKYVEAGLNDFIDFQIDYVEDIYDDFSKVMDIS
ncbi:HDOD domain-containing protein [Sulfurimonas sp.]|uniref:HDOD domain-containing protein n=1 Tax=Sulfurimonas sp. TaxID=2022749 RepID=UPI0025F1FCE9|nr:HDOD domain-containing protein [Sulfurimonas sp.]